MNDVQAGRFKDAEWFPKEDMEVIVGGAGGIGSWLTMLLSRLAMPNIYVYDFDTLEVHNMSGQLYGKQHIGQPKVVALADVCQSFADTTITGLNEKLDENSMATNFMFGAFDNMEARKTIFELWKGHVAEWSEAKARVDAGESTWEKEDMLPYTPIYIDGRLTLEQIQVFCVTPDKIEAYEKDHLFPDGDVEEAECTLKQTSHTAALIGGMMVGLFTNHLGNVINGTTEREVPFLYQYLTPLVYTEVE